MLAEEGLTVVVAICTYNNAGALDLALAALERQRTSPGLRWGVLVVDNNSTDETGRVVETHRKEAAIPCLDLVREPRQGLAFARHRAALASSAPILAFVDDDCLLEPDWVEAAAAFFSEHPRAGVVGGQVDVAWAQAPEPWLLQFATSFAQQNHGPNPLRFPARGVIRLVGAGLACRRSALEQSGWLTHRALVGRQGQALTAGEDVELVLRIRYAGYEAWYTPALRLRHFIPRRRMQKDYLYRLHRGFGQARLALYLVEMGHRPTRSRAIRAIGYSLRELLKASVASLVHRRGEAGILHRAAVFEAIGQVEGAWRLLFANRRQLASFPLARPGVNP